MALDGPMTKNATVVVGSRTNVLAASGPTWVRGGTSLPIAGFMQLDKADVPALRNNKGLSTVIRHEMAHVLGFGTLWDKVGLVSVPPVTATCQYTGPLANAEYQAVSGCTSDTSLPLQMDGQGGPNCAHWAEDCLRTELMTPNYDIGLVIGLSQMTIASLQDLGYNVSYKTARPWVNADLGASCTCRRSGRGGHSRRLGDAASKQPLPSASAYQTAVDYGKRILRANAQSKMPERYSSGMDDDDLVYVGDQVVSVVIEENGVVHSIMVTN
jgi:Leishmanolysin